jgi:hypothetical protein
MQITASDSPFTVAAINHKEPSPSSLVKYLSHTDHVPRAASVAEVRYPCSPRFSSSSTYRSVTDQSGGLSEAFTNSQCIRTHGVSIFPDPQSNGAILTGPQDQLALRILRPDFPLLRRGVTVTANMLSDYAVLPWSSRASSSLASRL